MLNHHFRNYGKLNCYDLYSLEIAKSFSIIMLTISNVLFSKNIKNKISYCHSITLCNDYPIKEK